MQQDAWPTLPAPTDPVVVWEQYLQGCCDRESQCRVRASAHDQTPQQREQVLLRRLSDTARESLEKHALSDTGASLQRQALELIRLRRRILPDDYPGWNKPEVFLGAAALHRAVHALIEEYDRFRLQHDLLHDICSRWIGVAQATVQGSLTDSAPVFTLGQQMRNIAADGTISPAEFLRFACGYAEYEPLQLNRFQRAALAQGLHAGYLASRLFRKQNWLIDTDAFLTAALFKDVAWFIPGADEKSLSRGQHAEWSAGLMAQCEDLRIAVPRLIREHHECLDGSGLPLGLSAAALRRDSRLMSVLTRWSELFVRGEENNRVDGKADNSLAGPTPVLVSESLEGRWDPVWISRLLENLQLPRPEGLPHPSGEPRQNANPHWRLPRPHFIQKQGVPLPLRARRPNA